MAERASLFEGVQIGLESVPGGSVAADKKLLALSIQPSVKADISTFRPYGSKIPNIGSARQGVGGSKLRRANDLQRDHLPACEHYRRRKHRNNFSVVEAVAVLMSGHSLAEVPLTPTDVHS
jgi:hypothetical protein